MRIVQQPHNRARRRPRRPRRQCAPPCAKPELLVPEGFLSAVIDYVHILRSGNTLCSMASLAQLSFGLPSLTLLSLAYWLVDVRVAS